MIKKLKFKFIAFTMASIAALLVIVLSVVNIVNFSLVAADADTLLGNLEKDGGVFTGMSIAPDNGEFPEPGEGQESKAEPESADPPPENPPENAGEGGKGPLPIGPNSMEMQSSIRYFTVTFNKEDQSMIRYRNLGVATDQNGKQEMTDEDVVNWAKELKAKKQGWSKIYYRYKVYKINGETYVTVVDYSRELRPSFNIMWASIFGSLGGLLLTFLVLVLIGERLVKPYADSDKKQRKFIAEASREIKSPVTVIALQNENLKTQFGDNESTRSIERQVERLNELALRLNELIVYDKQTLEKAPASLTAVVKETFAEVAGAMEGRGVELHLDVSEGVMYDCEEAAMRKAVLEMADNAAKFAKSVVNVKLSVKDERIVLRIENDTDDFIEGPLDRVFDRFFKEHPDTAGKGLGLSVAKAIVTDHGGRIKAYKKEDKFVLKTEL